MPKLSTKVGLAVIALVAAAAAAFVVVSGLSGQSSGEVVANVNGEPILMEELVDQLIARQGESMLNRMVRELVVEQEAKKAGVDVSQEEVDAEIEAIRAQFPSEEAYMAALERAGHTPDTLRRDVLVELRLQRLLGERVQVTEEELQQVYEQNKDQLEGATFEESRERLSSLIYENKMDREVGEWLKSKLSESEIEILLDERRADTRG